MRSRPPIAQSLLFPVLLGLLALGCAKDRTDPAGHRAHGIVGAVEELGLARAAPQIPELEDPIFEPDPPNYDPWEEPRDIEYLVVERLVLRSAEAFESTFGVSIVESEGSFDLVHVVDGGNAQAKAADMIDSGWVESAEPASIYFLGLEIILGFFEGDQPPFPSDEGWRTRTDLYGLQAIVEGSGVKVAILDSGVNAVIGSSLATRLTADGWDYVDNDAEPKEAAGGAAFGHGTLVADLVHQVASQANLMPMRVMNSEGVVRAWAVRKAVRRAVAQGASVINMSFGGHVSPRFLERAFEDAVNQGVVLLASVGNAGVQDDAHYPSGSDHVCGVGATNWLDQRAVFSSYGRDVEIAAPGQGLTGRGADGQQAIGSGTSFAAPLVSGAIAARMQLNEGLSPDMLRMYLASSSLELSNDVIYRLGLFAGRIDFDDFLANKVPD